MISLLETIRLLDAPYVVWLTHEELGYGSGSVYWSCRQPQQDVLLHMGQRSPIRVHGNGLLSPGEIDACLAGVGQ